LEDILTVRIGCGTGFWGDDIDAPLRLVEGADLDYLVMDFLAEVTMSILKKAQLRNSQMGYATDVVPIIAGLIDTAVRKNTRVLSNAGGVNPAACAAAVAQAAKEKGSDIRVAWITGDDVLEQLDVIAQSLSLANIDDGREFATVRDQVLSANVYLGAGPLVEGLRGGAQVVLCGRSTDTALVLAPLIAEYGWAEDDWDRRAAGIVAGHLIECSGQVTGGMHQAGWQEVPGIDLVGYPIVEVEEDGTFVVTKPEGTGGLVNIETVTEQLIYEIQDPRAFQTPDVTCDFTTLRLEQVGPDRVRVSDVSGGPPPETSKVSITYGEGWTTTMLWPYAEPDPVAKAEATLRRTLATIERLGLQIDEIRTDIFGTGAIMGPRASKLTAPPIEVLARLAARSSSKSDLERLGIEIAPAYNGAAGHAGFVGGPRGRVSQVVSHWPALVPADSVYASVSFIG
jgi:hypothetical protein